MLVIQVIAGQVDVLPAQRRQVLQQAVINGLPMATQGVRSTGNQGIAILKNSS